MSVAAMDVPGLEGSLRHGTALAPLTWLRVGGPADYLALPAGEADLATFLQALDPAVPVTPIGVASNLLVRDGGIEGVVVRLSGPLARVDVTGSLLVAGAGALDQRVARDAHRAGLSGLEFMIGIPGSIGGAVAMNAGAFGGETADRLRWIETLDRRGRRHRIEAAAIGMRYRHADLPAGHIVLRAAFALEAGDPARIGAAMARIRSERERTQPLRVATGGSTFKNPLAGPSVSPKAWQLIDEAGCRGLVHGRAKVSEKHCNFLINTGGATAREVEELGEMVRNRVEACTQIELEWEIRRVGRALPLAGGTDR